MHLSREFLIKLVHHPFVLIGTSLIIFGLFYGPLIGYTVKFTYETSGALTINSEEFSPSIYIASSLKKDDFLTLNAMLPLNLSESQLGILLTSNERFNEFEKKINDFWVSFTNSNRTEDDMVHLSFLYKAQASWLMNTSFINLSNVTDMAFTFSASSSLKAIAAIVLLDWNETTTPPEISLAIEVKRNRETEFLLAGSSCVLGISILVSAFLLSQKQI
ncbi:MAG: hypothetical protein ACFFCQ_06160 [Promethearchaeota archaeon]